MLHSGKNESSYYNKKLSSCKPFNTMSTARTSCQNFAISGSNAELQRVIFIDLRLDTNYL